MKRIISLLMTLALLLGCTAMAEAPAVTTVTVPESGVAFDVPSDWYYTVTGHSEGSSLAELFGLPAEFLDAYLSQNGFSFYATLDEQELSVLYLVVAPGTPLVDMRDQDVDMDALMAGFMQTFTVGTVVDSSAYATDECTFARILCTAAVDGGTADLLVYACNTNSTVYVFNFAAMPGGEFPVAELDALISSVDFLD